jgi:hypothetical protein
LQTALVKLIPDTIKDDNDEQELTDLENKLKIFQNDSKDEEKAKIYKEYKTFIDQILTEISQERQRFQQAKSDLGISESSNTNQGQQNRLPSWSWAIIIVGSIIAIGTIILFTIKSFQESSEKE